VPANAPLAKPAMRSNLRPTVVLLNRCEASLQVVEDETRRCSLARDGDDRPLAGAGHCEHLAVTELGVELGDTDPFAAELGRALEQLPRGTRNGFLLPLGDTHRTRNSALSGHNRRRLDLRRDLDEIRERSPRIHDSDGIKVQTSRP
jgi:hypothetical protein